MRCKVSRDVICPAAIWILSALVTIEAETAAVGGLVGCASARQPRSSPARMSTASGVVAALSRFSGMPVSRDTLARLRLQAQLRYLGLTGREKRFGILCFVVSHHCLPSKLER